MCTYHGDEHSAREIVGLFKFTGFQMGLKRGVIDPKLERGGGERGIDRRGERNGGKGFVRVIGLSSVHYSVDKMM